MFSNASHIYIDGGHFTNIYQSWAPECHGRCVTYMHDNGPSRLHPAKSPHVLDGRVELACTTGCVVEHPCDSTQGLRCTCMNWLEHILTCPPLASNHRALLSPPVSKFCSKNTKLPNWSIDDFCFKQTTCRVNAGGYELYPSAPVDITRTWRPRQPVDEPPGSPQGGSGPWEPIHRRLRQLAVHRTRLAAIFSSYPRRTWVAIVVTIFIIRTLSVSTNHIL